MTEQSTTPLFAEALDVMNAALARHKDAAPYKQMLGLSEKLIGGRNIGVSIYDQASDRPIDACTVTFEEERFQLVSDGQREPGPEITWKVSREYLEKVVENREDYLAHPAKLDWDWLKSRMGIVPA
ncbi:MAG: hypothetical protein R3F21_03580 [Myxococcota bacterium]